MNKVLFLTEEIERKKSARGWSEYEESFGKRKK